MVVEVFLKGGLFVFHLLDSIASTWSMYTFAKFDKTLSTHLSSHPLYNQHVRVVSRNETNAWKNLCQSRQTLLRLIDHVYENTAFHILYLPISKIVRKVLFSELN